MTNLNSVLKSRHITLPTNFYLVKAMVFPVVVCGCESWPINKAERRRIDAFELQCWRRLENPLECKEIKSVHPKGNQSWIVIGRTDIEAETQILCPPDAKSWLIRKDSDAGKDWGQEEKGMTENKMVGWHHQLNGNGELVKDREAWHAAVYGVAKNWTRLSDSTTTTTTVMVVVWRLGWRSFSESISSVLDYGAINPEWLQNHGLGTMQMMWTWAANYTKVHDRGWDGWMAPPTQWTWVWVDSGSWWWTVRPGVLRFMGSQRVGHDWATELNWITCSYNFSDASFQSS